MRRIFHIMHLISIRNILRNFLLLIHKDIRNEIIIINIKLNELMKEIESLRKSALYNRIMDYFYSNPFEEYHTEIAFLKTKRSIQVFPYLQIKKLERVIAEYDAQKKMPYVYHEDSKKLYFPKGWTVEMAKATYCKYIEVENLLGGNFCEKSPHQYQSENIKVIEGDIVFDIGSAEALFALDCVELAKKIFVIEENSKWLEPLEATFEPYKDKVIIINKRLSDINDSENVTIEHCLANIEFNSVFIKMDIEGGEKEVVAKNEAILILNKNIRLACCTYHHHDDAEKLESAFSALGYNTEFSDGFMLFHYDNNIQPPFFRKGLIRAKRITS